MLQTILSSWGVEQNTAQSINDIRLKYIPVSQEAFIQKKIVFHKDDLYYEINTTSSFAKGTNGKLFNAFLMETSTNRYIPLVAKRVPSCLNSVREAALHALVYEEQPKNIPKIYTIFRTKNHIWILMEDLRLVEKKNQYSYCLYSWLENASVIFNRGLASAGFRKIISKVLKSVLHLSKKYSFLHGDLHTGNIYIQGSKNHINKVIVIDFGYSMISSTGKHSKSHYWLSYKDGIDAAVLLWSLYNSSAFQKSADATLLSWVSSKLLLTNGIDLKSFKNLKDVYEKLENSSSDDLIRLKIATLVTEFAGI